MIVLEAPPIKASGLYKARKLDINGKVMPFLDREGKLPADSVINNALLDNFFTDIVHSAIQVFDTSATLKVGQGTNAVEFNQTSLTTLSAFVLGVGINSVVSNIVGDTNFVTFEYVATFALGALDGNYTEVGAWLRSNNGTSAVHSRALVVDPLGDPSVISVSPTEQLVLTYLLTLAIPWTVQAGTFTQVLNGVESTVNYQAACAYSTWNSNARQLFGAPLNGTVRMYNAGSIGAVGSTAGPSGTFTSAGTITQAFPSGEKTSTLSLSITDRADPILFMRTDYFKWGFTPALPKTGARTLSITFRQQITRA